MMLMREYQEKIDYIRVPGTPCVVRAYSHNAGETWLPSELVRDLDLPPDDTSAISVKRIPSTGDLLLLRCTGNPPGPNPKSRTPFVSAISTDDGSTWPIQQQKILLGNPQEDYGYPGLIFVGDTALISVTTLTGLAVIRVSTQWFYP